MSSKKTEWTFSRWIPHEKSTWAYQIFKKYDEQIKKNIWAFQPIPEFVYKTLKSTGAKWGDLPSTYMKFLNGKFLIYKDLKEWAKSFNDFTKWAKLNTLMAISSNFETFLDNVITLSILSDPGVVVGASKSIDGMFLIKNGSTRNYDLKGIVTNCVKGDWNSRWMNIHKLFPNIPDTISKSTSDLEYLRKIRNDIGHSYGRNLEETREITKKAILPFHNVDIQKVNKIQNLVRKIAKEVDLYLLNNHIGEFQFLNLYHSMYPKMNKTCHYGIRAKDFKKAIGRSGVSSVSDDNCKQIVKFYESL